MVDSEFLEVSQEPMSRVGIGVNYTQDLYVSAVWQSSLINPQFNSS